MCKFYCWFVRKMYNSNGTMVAWIVRNLYASHRSHQLLHLNCECDNCHSMEQYPKDGKKFSGGLLASCRDYKHNHNHHHNRFELNRIQIKINIYSICWLWGYKISVYQCNIICLHIRTLFENWRPLENKWKWNRIYLFVGFAWFD